MPAKTISKACPCGGAAYASCCEPIHGGQAAATAEQLMRARYSAYVLGKTDFVHQSWHVSTRPTLSDLEPEAGTKWLGLEVKRHEPQADDAAIVEFVARYKLGGRAHRLHEVSRFLREDGQWFYLDGQFPAR